MNKREKENKGLEYDIFFCILSEVFKIDRMNEKFALLYTTFQFFKSSLNRYEEIKSRKINLNCHMSKMDEKYKNKCTDFYYCTFA